jgi:hypothetical protein
MLEFKVWIDGKRRPDLDKPGVAFRNCHAYHLHLKAILKNVGVIVNTPASRWRSKADAF